MTVYSYSRVLVWDNLGGSVKVARNQRVDVTDPATGSVAAGLTVKGQPVSYVTSDGDGHVTFASTMGLVRLTSQRGFWQDVESPDLRSGAVRAGLDAAAAAASAAASASSAQNAAADAATQTLAGAQSRLDASASAAATSASAAAGSATAARDSAGLVGAPAGAAVDARLSSGLGFVAAASASVADVQAALDNAAINGKRALAYGTITTSSTLLIKGDCDLSQLTINYTGTGIAVQVGDLSSALVFRKAIRLPVLINPNKPSAGWVGVTGTIGVKIINANSCDFDIPYVSGFETGIEHHGETAGYVYSDHRLGFITGCKIGQRFSANVGGWVNQNTFRAGRFSLSSGEGNRAAGTRCVLMDPNGNPINGNTWVGTALEGNQWEYVIETSGSYNQWIGCRWEASLGAQIWWRAASTRNKVLDGYAAPVPVNEAGATRNEIAQTGSSKNVVVSSTSGAFNMQNDSSGTAPAWTVVNPAFSMNTGNDPATAYSWAATSLLLKGKRGGDSFDRIQIDANSGQILFGDGTAAPTMSITYNSASFLKVSNASLYPTTNNAQDIGINANRWRNAYLGKVWVSTASGGPSISSGAGTPEGVVSAVVGSLFMRTDGGAGSSLYVKESGAAATGWVAK